MPCPLSKGIAYTNPMRVGEGMMRTVERGKKSWVMWKQGLRRVYVVCFILVIMQNVSITSMVCTVSIRSGSVFGRQSDYLSKTELGRDCR